MLISEDPNDIQHINKITEQRGMFSTKGDVI